MTEELKHLTVNRIKKILGAGDFDKLLGVNENENFEAKSFIPYDLKTGGVRAIMSLVTDIVQFSNKQEAYIVCGLKCSDDKSVPHDIVASLELGKKDDFLSSYKDVPGIVESNVYPKPSGITVLWYPYAKDVSLGLGVIHIPEQLEERKWFIVDIHGEEKTFVGKTFFGIPVRNGEDKEWKDKKEIYKLTRNTPRDVRDLYGHITDQFQNMRDHLENLFHEGTGDSKTKLSTMIEEVLNDK
ncbi:MAG: hypothetical protein ACM3IJ_00155 [Candidatus Levyibacteriota bacterium]